MKTKNLKLEVNILVGLPHSGKTHWAKQNFHVPIWSRSHSNVYLDLDGVDKRSNIQLNLHELFENNYLNYIENDTYSICIDYDCLTLVDIGLLVDATNRYFKNHYKSCEIYYVIHQWEYKITQCVNNGKIISKYRKDFDTKMNLIVNSKPYDFSIEDLKKLHEKCRIEKHGVPTLGIYDVLFAPLGHEGTNYLCSESWTTGGTCNDCWGGSYNIQSENPRNFTEFDELIEKIYEDISFIKYNKLKAACVTMEEDHEYDYYGGCQYYAYWKCDLRKLYDMLIEMGIIKEELL